MSPEERLERLYTLAENHLQFLQREHPRMGIVIILTQNGQIACETNLSKESLQTAASVAVQTKCKKR